MSESANYFIAEKHGTIFTQYAAMASLGIPLTEHQANTQKLLEEKFPPCYCPIVVIAFWLNKGDKLEWLMSVIDAIPDITPDIMYVSNFKFKEVKNG